MGCPACYWPVTTISPRRIFARRCRNTFVQQSNQLITAPQILFGTTPATVIYAGLAPNNVGLYQFNVMVPSITASDKVPVTFTLGGVPGTQTLYTAVQ